MKQQVAVPAVGESVSSGILATWLKADGEAVSEGENIYELETDKATMEVPAPTGGVIHHLVDAGTEVEIGAIVAEIDSDGTPSVDADGSADTGGSANAGSRPSLSPAVRRLMEEHSLDPTVIPGTGKDGRLTKGDVLAYLDGIGTTEAPTGSSKAPTDTSSAHPPTGGAGAAAPVPGAADLQVRKPMSNLRRRIAENLVASRHQSAHLTTFNEVDMSMVMSIRSRYKEPFEKRHGVKLGFMSFFVKAAQRGLAASPEVNAYVDGTDIVYNNFFNVGVAISTDAGLVVPVLRNVEAMGFAEIEAKIIDFGERAKTKKIMPDEFVGGTFTITNGGVFGSMLSTPIPSPPQTAVLGMHAIQKRPVVVDDQIVIRPMMYLALTYDHRILDGREAIRFLLHIRNQIEDPTQLLLEL